MSISYREIFNSIRIEVNLTGFVYVKYFFKLDKDIIKT